MAKTIVLRLKQSSDLPISINVNEKGQQILQHALKEMLEHGLADVIDPEDERLSIDDTNLQTIHIVYKDTSAEKMASLAAGSLAVVNPEVAPVFDAFHKHPKVR